MNSITQNNITNNHPVQNELIAFRKKKEETINTIVIEFSKWLNQETLTIKNDPLSGLNPLEKMQLLKKQWKHASILKNMFGLQLEIHIFLLVREKLLQSSTCSQEIHQMDSAPPELLIQHIKTQKLCYAKQKKILFEKIRSISIETLKPTQNAIDITCKIEPFEEENQGVIKKVYEKCMHHYTVDSLEQNTLFDEHQPSSLDRLNSCQLYLTLKILNKAIALQKEVLCIPNFGGSHQKQLNQILRITKESDCERAYHFFSKHIIVFNILIKKQNQLLNREIYRISKDTL